MFEMAFKFLKLVKIIVLQTKRLAVQSTAYALHITDKVNKRLSKKIKKEKSEKNKYKPVKSLRYMDEFFSD